MSSEKPIKPQMTCKILRTEQMKVHTMFGVGKRDMKADAVGVRVHGKGNLGAKPRAELVAEVLQAVKSDSLKSQPILGAGFVVSDSKAQSTGRQTTAASRISLKNLCQSVDQKNSQCRSNRRTRFVPVCALLVGVRDLQNARFIQRFA